WDQTNRKLYLLTHSGVRDRLYSYDVDSGDLKQRPLPIDVVSQLSIAKSGHLYMLGTSSTTPPNIYQSIDGKSWQPLTDNRVLGVKAAEMVEPEVITYKSYDGMEIEALLFKAKPEHDNGHTIFWPHGGPQAAERKMFRAM